MTSSIHRSVLLKEAIDALALVPGDIYFDATLGAGGHAEEVWQRLGKDIVISGVDADPLAIEAAKVRLELLGASPKVMNSNFRKLDQAISLLDIGTPTKILFDLGWNKQQFEAGGKGFSFQKDEPLLMTFGSEPEKGFTAEDIVNSWEWENIETIISAYGEEKFAWRISKAIVEAREKAPIKTSGQLSEIVKNVVPIFYRFGRIHPATKTFQALRIAVNDELQALEEGLDKAFEVLAPGGIMTVISFHSLEDRIVKRFFKKLEEGELGTSLSKKPLIPSDIEIEQNPRSRSAKLRSFQKNQ